MGKAPCRALLFRGAVRLFSLSARASVLDRASRALALALFRALGLCGGSGLRLFLMRLFLAGAHIFFVLLELFPPLGGAGRLDRQALGRLAVVRFVTLRQLFRDGFGKADVRQRQQRARRAPQRSAEVLLRRRDLKADALARLAEVERAAARVVRRIRGDEDEPRVLASCRRADGLFTDLQLSGLFGKADQIEQFIHRLPSPFPFLRRRSRGWPCPARARARGICAPA